MPPNTKILNDPAFRTLLRSYHAQARAVAKVFADIAGEEMGPEARELFMRELLLRPTDLVNS